MRDSGMRADRDGPYTNYARQPERRAQPAEAGERVPPSGRSPARFHRSNGVEIPPRDRDPSVAAGANPGSRSPLGISREVVLATWGLGFAQQQASRYQELARTRYGSAQNAQQYTSQLGQQQQAALITHLENMRRRG
jgi:hypothetical protein